MHAGKPINQSLAIAYAMKKRAKKMADGGMAQDHAEYRAQQRRHNMATSQRKMAEDKHKTQSNIHEMTQKNNLKGVHNGTAAGHVDRMQVKPHHSEILSNDDAKYMARDEHHRVLNEMRDMKKPNLKGLAEGGFVGSYQSPKSGMHQDHFHDVDDEASGYMEHEGDHKRPNHMAMHEDHRDLNQHGEMEEGPEGHATYKEDEPHMMANGGMMSPMRGEQDHMHEEDMIGRIMKKRQHMYSRGGRIANDTPETADFESNDFDDLANRDHLEFSYTGKNSGDELSNEFDSNHSDPVARVMMKRKKQHNPRPA